MRSKLQELRKLKKIVKKKREDGLIQQFIESHTQEGLIQSDNKEYISEQVQQIKQSQPKLQIEEKANEEEFEDEFQDEYQQQQQGWQDVGEVQEQENKIEEQHQKKDKKSLAYLGNNKNLKKGQYLQFDNKAYDMLHRLTTQWPCLSVDFIIGENPFGNNNRTFTQMNKYPYEIYTVSGTQSQKNNYLYLAKWSKLHKTKYDDDSEDYQDDEDNDILNDEQPEISLASVQTKYCINRLRALNYSPIVAYWNQNAEVVVTNLTKKYRQLRQGIKNNHKEQKSKDHIFKQSTEGYAINWNPNKMGELISGNLKGQVYIYEPNESLTGWLDGKKYTHHSNSVQDVQFSPEQQYAFATCSVDGTLQIVDMRVGNYKKSQVYIKAHNNDINVLDWNSKAKHLIATGSDDCTVKVWDLRMHKSFGKGIYQELICFNWHNQPITSIAFQPNQESVLAVASQDNRLTIWDLAVENEEQQNEVPNQMMFLHQGQEDIKEIRYHPIYFEMLTSTANNGINTFKPSFDHNQEQQSEDDTIRKEPINQQELEEYLNKLSLK